MIIIFQQLGDAVNGKTVKTIKEIFKDHNSSSFALNAAKLNQLIYLKNQ